MRRTRATGGLLAGLAVLATACTAEPHGVVEDTERGCRYTPPPDWRVFDGELRSRDSSLLSIRVFSLVGADPTFVQNLPESIVPQLEQSAQSYYVVEGEPTRTPATIAGLPALEVSWTVRVRATDPPTKLLHWVVRNGDRLFVLRTSFAPRAIERDEAALREMLETWSFLDSGATPPPPAAG